MNVFNIENYSKDPEGVIEIPSNATQISQTTFQRDAWDKAAESWQAEGLTLDERQHVTSMINSSGLLANVRQGSIVLDLAPGIETYLPAEVVNKATIMSTDISRSMLERNPTGEGTKAVGDAVRLPYRDASFDATLCTFMMRYLDLNGQLTALKEMVRVTKAGGSILVIDFEANRHKMQRMEFTPNYLLVLATRQKIFKPDKAKIFGDKMSDLPGKYRAELRGLLVEV